MVDDIEFKDEIDYPIEQKYSIREIILRQIKKIGDICCKEFTGGYWEKKPIKTQSGFYYSEVYHNDVREEYCNAVDFVIDLVYPLSDKELKDYLDEHEGFGEKDGQKNEKVDIKEKLVGKRKTFRQINMMFQRTNFWEGTESYNE